MPWFFAMWGSATPCWWSVRDEAFITLSAQTHQPSVAGVIGGGCMGIGLLANQGNLVYITGLESNRARIVACF